MVDVILFIRKIAAKISIFFFLVIFFKASSLLRNRAIWMTDTFKLKIFFDVKFSCYHDVESVNKLSIYR